MLIKKSLQKLFCSPIHKHQLAYFSTKVPYQKPTHPKNNNNAKNSQPIFMTKRPEKDHYKEPQSFPLGDNLVEYLHANKYKEIPQKYFIENLEIIKNLNGNLFKEFYRLWGMNPSKWDMPEEATQAILGRFKD